MPYSFNATFLKQQPFMQLLLSPLPFFIESEAGFSCTQSLQCCWKPEKYTANSLLSRMDGEWG
jgi:hypothetical protein